MSLTEQELDIINRAKEAQSFLIGNGCELDAEVISGLIGIIDRLTVPKNSLVTEQSESLGDQMANALAQYRKQLERNKQ